MASEDKAPLLEEQQQASEPQKSIARRHWRLVLTVIGALGLLACGAQVRRYTVAATPYGLYPVIARSLGLYSPWQSSPKAAEPYSVPSGCVVNQVSILERHGSRYPTADAAARIGQALDGLRQATSYRGDLSFFPSYRYELETEVLVPSGVKESFIAGAIAFNRYGQLAARGSEPPFVRTTSKDRVVSSAFAWIQGFADASGRRTIPQGPLVISDAAGSNNSIHNSCPSGDSTPAFDAMRVWEDIWAAPIAERLEGLAPGANITPFDVPQLMSLCGFETALREKPSKWCSLFTHDEWIGFEYYHDIYLSYDTAYGNELGPVQGAGYVNELIARLTDSPVKDSTTTNRSLDADPSTFPLDRTLYADFTHDMLLAAVYAAIGLFNDNSGRGLEPSRNSSHTWIASELCPFAGRMVTERLRCDSDHRVRILVNDAVQPLEFCGADSNKTCAVDDFVASQRYVRSPQAADDWRRCLST